MVLGDSISRSVGRSVAVDSGTGRRIQWGEKFPFLRLLIREWEWKRDYCQQVEGGEEEMDQQSISG